MQAPRYGFGLAAAVVGLLIAGVAGVIGYNLGLNANIAASGAATQVVYGGGWGWGFGFPLFGLFFGILFFVLIFGVIRRAIWGGYRGYGPGGPGQHGWHGYDVPPAADSLFQDWHRRAHGDPTPPNAPTGFTNPTPPTSSAAAERTPAASHVRHRDSGPPIP